MMVLDQHPDRKATAVSTAVLLTHPSAPAIMPGFSPQLLSQWLHTSVGLVLLTHVAEDKFISISSRLSGSWQVQTCPYPLPCSYWEALPEAGRSPGLLDPQGGGRS